MGNQHSKYSHSLSSEFHKPASFQNLKKKSFSSHKKHELVHVNRPCTVNYNIAQPETNTRSSFIKKTQKYQFYNSHAVQNSSDSTLHSSRIDANSAGSKIENYLRSESAESLLDLKSLDKTLDDCTIKFESLDQMHGNNHNNTFKNYFKGFSLGRSFFSGSDTDEPLTEQELRLSIKIFKDKLDKFINFLYKENCDMFNKPNLKNSDFKNLCKNTLEYANIFESEYVKFAYQKNLSFSDLVSYDTMQAITEDIKFIKSFLAIYQNIYLKNSNISESLEKTKQLWDARSNRFIVIFKDNSHISSAPPKNRHTRKTLSIPFSYNKEFNDTLDQDQFIKFDKYSSRQNTNNSYKTPPTKPENSLGLDRTKNSSNKSTNNIFLSPNPPDLRNKSTPSLVLDNKHLYESATLNPSSHSMANKVKLSGRGFLPALSATPQNSCYLTPTHSITSADRKKRSQSMVNHSKNFENSFSVISRTESSTGLSKNALSTRSYSVSHPRDIENNKIVCSLALESSQSTNKSKNNFYENPSHHYINHASNNFLNAGHTYLLNNDSRIYNVGLSRKDFTIGSSDSSKIKSVRSGRSASMVEPHKVYYITENTNKDLENARIISNPVYSNLNGRHRSKRNHIRKLADLEFEQLIAPKSEFPHLPGITEQESSTNSTVPFPDIESSKPTKFPELSPKKAIHLSNENSSPCHLSNSNKQSYYSVFIKTPSKHPSNLNAIYEA
ncbi:hypothetical protein AYI70_g11276 [Smittium culicis]|uniref:Uncharacterized protein n=1 Tax=Smittium culicis TaxID=133412 RepID=A0A1R1X2K3_9FUNG|nr:hypothetical protein AYI70_g11276 [Smittium culicis]